MEQPLVSVIIPNYNYAMYVGQAIESALNQDYEPIEVVVVDNGSTDNSKQILQRYSDRVRVIFQENRGQAGARNRGIQECKGEFIAFLDADDVWMPGKISKQMPLFSDASVGLVYTGFKNANKSLQALNEVIPENRGRLLKNFANGAAAVILGGESTAVIRRTCFDQLGVFDEKLSISSGFDMYRRIAGCYSIELVAEALMLYRQHGSNQSRNVEVFEHDLLIVLEKMFSDPQAVEILPLKKRSYAKSFFALSGAYLKVGNYRKSLSYLARGALESPSEIIYPVVFPIRLIRRVFNRFKEKFHVRHHGIH